jgi:hypothetical protein
MPMRLVSTVIAMLALACNSGDDAAAGESKA